MQCKLPLGDDNFIFFVKDLQTMKVMKVFSSVIYVELVIVIMKPSTYTAKMIVEEVDFLVEERIDMERNEHNSWNKE